eukprot:TRINITY_DN36263_c0_g1_i1.p1 TRINITY_DN36263_c0_g1~~TRINITY_DN36263_c0_g1_i1.p1  ORF type:complete len:288 (-),score=65.46 TRINITY_DN36263_c0_g1_i1:150-956(-)
MATAGKSQPLPWITDVLGEDLRFFHRGRQAITNLARASTGQTQTANILANIGATGNIIGEDGKNANEDQLGNVRSSDALTAELRILVFYFSGRWCPMCVEFDHLFKDLYARIKALSEGSDVEVVWVSCDLGEDAYKAHLKKLGSMLAAEWSPHRLEALTARYNVKAIPSLVVLDAQTGRVVTGSGREDCLAKEKISPEDVVLRWLELLDEKKAMLDDANAEADEDEADASSDSALTSSSDDEDENEPGSGDTPPERGGGDGEGGTGGD